MGPVRVPGQPVRLHLSTRNAAAPDEETHNGELVGVLKKRGVELIAITDHYRVNESLILAEAARAAGIVALLGFEAATSEGVHLLCMFDEACDAGTIDRRIGQCGVDSNDVPSPIGTLGIVDLMAKCVEWDAPFRFVGRLPVLADVNNQHAPRLPLSTHRRSSFRSIADRA